MLTNTVTKVFNMKPWNIFKFWLLITQTRNPDFHKHTKLSIFALLPTLYCHIFAVSFCIFYHMMLVTVKLDRSISRYKRITFQGCRFFLSSSFPMARLKQSWKYWNSYCGEFVKTFIIILQWRLFELHSDSLKFQKEFHGLYAVIYNSNHKTASFLHTVFINQKFLFRRCSCKKVHYKFTNTSSISISIKLHYKLLLQIRQNDLLVITFKFDSFEVFDLFPCKFV